jgi:hypothetical protein
MYISSNLADIKILLIYPRQTLNNSLDYLENIH